MDQFQPWRAEKREEMVPPNGKEIVQFYSIVLT